MKAMILDGIYNMNEVDNPLRPEDLPTPEPKEGEMLLRVSACGVCHTELDEIEGRTPPPDFPVILGHQVIGFVEKKGKNVNRLKEGERVGVGWIYSSCGRCRFCKGGNENLCEDFKATGRDANGGYAEFMVVKEDFAFKIPDVFTDIEAAPLLCAGAIGYRSLRLTGIENGMNLGLIGFGASAHIVLQMARFKYPDSRIFVFARSEGERRFSLELGAYWAGDIEDMPPEKIHCAIDTTPVWLPVMEGLKKLEKGGRLVINAIRKETLDRDCLLNLDYPTHIWHEKEIKSVANVARNDIGEFLELSSQIPIKPEVQVYRLEDANMALSELKKRKIRGAKVLKIIE
ncbi:MAG TPA: zinc-dependent alcohol dehydrogenase family protein [Syntrophorhabdaceae bacterium]|nr:zinc-dependent alcohol dehydrogenase family protein [Syntrophorhabdaceae bacterium]HOT42545.1 zinc-dependent alcohol dehydrogenase family protein [Syntrophorhabdaceae bacterium]HQE80681.1 zinc-dependent alcohol dehydrogenase family protein [Syntrophorhabdaceae bacterium]HQH43777.1 zinc-dependent alcohol dehydrogenase family protein [Syntrophorhabdaceae bacterium]HQK46898.1 zinc-dependent alcohol dehydrogenase family protein [Syntrophorhabdaceae bacterium]